MLLAYYKCERMIFGCGSIRKEANIAKPAAPRWANEHWFADRSVPVIRILFIAKILVERR